jgi:monofunctional biosynthetic peptidoglycan transglycosylase
MSKRIPYYIYLAFAKCCQVVLTLVLTAVLTVLFVVYALRSGPVSITPLMVINERQHAQPPKKRWVPLDSISPDLMRAVIVCEDNNFFYHRGFDIEAIKIALKRNSSQSRKTYGASTISQQTAKNVLLPPARTWLRKGAEAGLTLLMESLWDKARIMEVYLNVIEMGKDTYGAEAAAQHYFKKHAAALNKSEGTLIAIALPNPQQFNPAKPSPYMLKRQQQVYEMMTKMLETGWYKHIRDIRQIKVNYLEQ